MIVFRQRVSGDGKPVRGKCMEFGSVMFLFRFLPVFILCYFMAPGRMKNAVLFLGSLCFYAWGQPVYVVLMLLSVLMDYLHGHLIDHYRGRTASRVFLCTSVLVSLGMMFLMVYGDYTIRTVNSLLGTEIPMMRLPVPFGIMVYTLQSLSYVAEVYRGRVKPQKSILDYGVYLSFFPQLAAGPIVRYPDVEGMLHERKVDLSGISTGVKRFCVGLAKKVLLADAAGELWRAVSVVGNTNLSAAAAWLGILAFAFQIYFSFSGYADMASGLASCVGFSFPENFRYPFMARSITEFCRNWNMTLTKWMKEYVYIPLGGSRKGALRQTVNVLLVWSLTGLWYGPDRTFLLWGLWMAVLLLIEKFFLGKLLEIMPGVLNWLYMVFLMSLGWVIFAMPDMQSIWSYFLAMAGQNQKGLLDDRFFYLVMEYIPILAAGILASTPLLSMAAAKIREKKSGACIALYRFGEKVLPGMLLLLSMIWIVGRNG